MSLIQVVTFCLMTIVLFASARQNAPPLFLAGMQGNVAMMNDARIGDDKYSGITVESPYPQVSSKTSVESVTVYPPNNHTALRMESKTIA